MESKEHNNIISFSTPIDYLSYKQETCNILTLFRNNFWHSRYYSASVPDLNLALQCNDDGLSHIFSI